MTARRHKRNAEKTARKRAKGLAAKAAKRQTAQRRAMALERNGKTRALSPAERRAEAMHADALAAEGAQLMVPGVLPRPAANGDAAMLKKTVATLSLTKAEMQRHRVALAACGFSSWQAWTLELLNREAERVIGGRRS